MIRILAVLLLAFPAFGTTVTIGVNQFTNGMVLSSGNFDAAMDVNPFNAISGDESDAGSNAFFLMSFSFAAPSGVTSASVLVSVWDLDSAATGNQIAGFILNGIDLTTSLNAVAEAANATSGHITYLNLDLPASTFAQIETGSVNLSLLFSGPGSGVLGDTTTYNAGGVDFASLTFGTGAVTPEPSSFLLAGGGLALILRKRYASCKLRTKIVAA